MNARQTDARKTLACAILALTFTVTVIHCEHPSDGQIAITPDILSSQRVTTMYRDFISLPHQLFFNEKRSDEREYLSEAVEKEENA